ncbi:hypothetical protein DEU56DRAFT_903958 [Suillus clintonianus]|uniref:uncharacterized protein n=1 Tax=Suillus clintonianus TaxID=1904413 RepID=UPI001B885D62|nr:uncharacterized protein DEU56DRAFT_903958 [Suillus clintonianus]KAG2124622.1 hypothetical protein DEU56DRAFT_903958 [Suillus clintonianus]
MTTSCPSSFCASSLYLFASALSSCSISSSYPSGCALSVCEHRRRSDRGSCHSSGSKFHRCSKQLELLLLMLARYKKMEYSADDIAAARNLQFLTYLASAHGFLNSFFLVLTWQLSVDGGILGRHVQIYSYPPLNSWIQTYDYACSLHTEWTFLLESRWTKVKSLYAITRHAPFLLLITELYMHFTPSEKLDEYVGTYPLMNDAYIPHDFTEMPDIVLYLLITYALWNSNRIVLAVMLSAFLAAVVASIIIGFITVGTSHVVTSAIPGILGCYRTSTNLSFIQFVQLFVFQLGLISLTLIRVIQSWRTNTGPMYAILVKHNIFYYASGLVLSAVNFLIIMLFYDSPYHSLLEDFECFFLTILATRMHLHLWQIDRNAHVSDALGMTLLSDIVMADPIAYSASLVE